MVPILLVAARKLACSPSEITQFGVHTASRELETGWIPCRRELSRKMSRALEPLLQRGKQDRQYVQLCIDMTAIGGCQGRETQGDEIWEVEGKKREKEGNEGSQQYTRYRAAPGKKPRCQRGAFFGCAAKLYPKEVCARLLQMSFSGIGFKGRAFHPSTIMKLRHCPTHQHQRFWQRLGECIKLEPFALPVVRPTDQ